MMSNPRSKQSAGVMLAFLALAVLVTIYTAGGKGSIGWSVPASKKPDVQMSSATGEDMEKLWNWADGELGGGSRAASWHLRWSVEGVTSDQAAKTAEALGMTADAKDLAGGKDENKTSGGILWEAVRTTAYGTLKMQLLGTVQKNRDAARQAVMTYHAPPAAELQAILNEMIEVNAALTETGTGGKRMMSIKLYGKAIRVGAAGRIAQKAAGVVLDEYKDSRTIVRTYSSTAVAGAMRLGEGKEGSRSANIQLAEHGGGDADFAAEITVGIPLITGDLSESGAEGT
ncbi:hypothetical protein [Paenibacillus sp. D9]|uniref:hypothetical protein n=1 Tax=Paenibacillus sp. D9 TaxID=665792 RepID=UPI0012EE1F44|nr:hypothetical protein [Paenibacillus sp. D9]